MAEHNKIRFSEIFYSFQGEGFHVGVPSVFFRTFGCNFECRGFGQPRGQPMPKEMMPHNTFDLTNIKHISELPVFDVGCDSSASWSKKYRHLTYYEDTDTIAQAILSLTPNKSWDVTKNAGFLSNIHLVITGGEPLLPGWQRQYPALLSSKYLHGLKNITFETNGSKELLPGFAEYLRNRSDLNVTWSISPKLSISGERKEAAINPAAVESIYNTIRHRQDVFYFKFVIRDEHCLDDLFYAINIYEHAGIGTSNIYLMPEGATTQGLSMTEEQVAKLALKYGFRYSPRLHVNIFGNKWGT